MADEQSTTRPHAEEDQDRGAPVRDGDGHEHSDDGARPALRALREDNDAQREYRSHVRQEERERAGPPDVLLDVPELRVGLIHLELDDLDAHVAVKANVLNLIKLNVGIDVHFKQVKLDVKDVEAEVVLKARLDHVTAIVDRLMTSLDRNPELIDGLSRAVAQIGEGAGAAVDKSGEAVKDVGAGTESALDDVGEGAGEAVGDVGEGAGEAVGDVGEGAGEAVEDTGEGAGQAVEDAGEGAGHAVGDVGKDVRKAIRDGADAAIGDKSSPKATAKSAARKLRRAVKT
jgi:hypothetical protein